MKEREPGSRKKGQSKERRLDIILVILLNQCHHDSVQVGFGVNFGLIDTNFCNAWHSFSTHKLRLVSIYS